MSTEEPQVPVVALDYCFMSEKDSAKITDKDMHPDDHAKILVGRDARSGCYCVMAVPHKKRVDPHEYATRRTLLFLDFLG